MTYFNTFLQWFWTVTISVGVLGAFYVCFVGWADS